jgi:hypothetical protein
MSVNINSMNNCNTFKGSVKKNENGVPYYHSTSGTTIGGVTAALAGGLYMSSAAIPKLDSNNPEHKKFLEGMLETMRKSMNNKNATIEDVAKKFEEFKKMAIPLAIVYAGAALGCGMLVDHIRNSKAKKAANQIASMPPEKALDKNPNIEVSENRKLYYKSNTGSKYGFALGAGVGIINILQELALFKKIRPFVAINSLVGMGAAGWLLGLLADHNTNKQASNNL